MTVQERFLKYVAFPTNSSEESETVPTTETQLKLADYLAAELKEIGMQEVTRDEFGYVYGYLPQTPGCTAPALGLIAHMDTSPAVSGENIRPATVHYTGGDIPLAAKGSIRTADFPFLENYVNQDLIITDGTTLLGADDKAGIAEIVSACAYYLAHPEIPHRAISVCFTPDEEVGCGAKHFDFSRFHAKVAYTVDGGEIGEIEAENFNAASATVRIHGVNIHPGSAKNKMKNAALMAADLINQLPAAETPAHTEGYEGFYHVCDMKGNESEAVIHIIIRDHDMNKFLARKEFMTRLIDYMNHRYGAGTFEMDLKDSYYNMKEKILPHPELIENAAAAMKSVGAEPKIIAIRGGTDGAMLSYRGLPCPNLSVGGANFHGVHEFVSIQAMEKMVEVLLYLTKAE